jgi:hypothetical protein
VEWGPVAGWVAAFVAFLGINAATIRWLLDRQGAQHSRDVSRVEGLARELNDLKVNLPLEYVRRDDWIRFSSTIDAKIDRMREEMRDEIRNLKVA